MRENKLASVNKTCECHSLICIIIHPHITCTHFNNTSCHMTIMNIVISIITYK